MKKNISFLVILFLSILTALPSFAQSEDAYKDISDSSYREAINHLASTGVLNGMPNKNFYPDHELTRAEAAVMLNRGFQLAEINPTVPLNPDTEKKLTYQDPLAVIDESFTIPTAKNLQGHWALEEIEGLFKIRAIEAEQEYDPDHSVTYKEWTDMMGKVIFGAQQSLDFQKNMSEYGFVSKDKAHLNEVITRGEAAKSMYDILSNSDFQIVTVFATSDIHGHLQPYVPSGTEQEIGGIAKMSQIVKKFRASHPDTLLLDAGDAPYNTNIANLSEGAATIEVMNEMGYDAMVLGNHDFDFPFSVMERNEGLAEFPFLSANTRYNGEHPNFLESYIMKEIEGTSIAILGVTDDQSHHFTHPKNVEGITFEDHFTAAENTVQEIREEADIVIGLSHLHGDNKVLPTKVEGFDLVIGGGEDIVDFPKQIGNSWLISPGKHAETLNQINIHMLDGQMLGFNFAHIFMTDNLENDPAVNSIIEKYESKIDEKMKTVVGETTVDLNGERETVRLKESNLANAIADSLRALTGADIALQNGGGVRASIPKGEITLEQIYGALPFDNTVVMVEASGQTIWKALEHGVASYPSAAGSFLQVSGLSYTIDPSQSEGSRVVEVLIDGEQIDLEKTYTVAANDFLTGGGDLFTMLKEDTVEVLRTKHFLRDAFAEYVEEQGTILPEVEGRIVILNGKPE
ncbi:2',3'-cyclic-nucleotide 2'-phosphodiesterase/5'-or 3'-nucleotidase, 5'-nucleotidase family [Gracilibacillus ureilyticus]|uniref:2',3'-cyclic-nucleotide 2'-phosphodiesterase/5'-or 3'-nucleotidase, 5'-nucleotidase family n=1 Tax=Gracilibacillus ureilyticus TaxID=531814 RepID=A0A1H9MPH4_9BACI|nr:5'-nucleotidase C-terminal domain-containing protein [Gracilibacillus ureilyticus]SER25325.1 2',3'-cyclic-nucleotide 2'-phosphodiesterase/5'-or 3'-nucleotidase, 5'-nucleotidase family [Gracilibacillus ureilyticus]